MPELPLDHRSVAPDEPADRPPAVVCLHGRGADEEDLLRPARALPDDCHVLSLRAPTPLGPGYTWYELDLSAGGIQRSQPDPDDFAESRDLVDDSVAAAIEEYDLDGDRIGLFGFSQGAVLGLASILDRPDRYAWVAALHGYLPASHGDVSRFDAADRSAFLGSGEADDVIPANRGREAADRLAEAGLDVTFRTYPFDHGIGQDELEDVVEWVRERY